METYDIYTVGQGELLLNVFQGISLLADSSFFGQLILLGGLVGGAIGVFKLVTTGSAKSLLTWFIAYLLVFGVVLTPRANVSIVDAGNPSVQNEVVEDIPFGLAFVAHIATVIGNEVGENLDLAFAPVDGFQYRENKAFWGPRIMNSVFSAEIADTNVQRNVDAFFQGCALPRFVGNAKVFDGFKNDSDVWDFLNATGGMTSSGFNFAGLSATTYDAGTGEPSTVNCSTAYNNINAELERVADQTVIRMAKEYYPDESESIIARDDMFADIETFGEDIIGLSFTGPEIIRQAFLLNQFDRSVSTYAGSATDAAMINFLNARSETSFRVGSIALGNLVQTGIPLLYTLILILLVAIFPVVILLAFLPTIGPKVMQNYLVSFIHMQAFIVLFVIINTMINFELARRGNSIFSATNKLEAGISFERMSLLNSIPTDVVATATIMLSLIPLYIGIFKGGVEALGTAFERTLQPYQEAAQTASGEFTSGNIRLADTSYANSTQNQYRTAPNADVFGSTVVSQGGASITQAGNGKVFAQGIASNLGSSAQFRESATESLRGELSTISEASQAATVEQSQALQKANGTTASFIASNGASNSEAVSSIFGDTKAYSEAYNAQEQIIEEYSQGNSKRASELRAIAWSGRAGLSASFGKGRGGAGGGPGAAGGVGGGDTGASLSGGFFVEARGEKSLIETVSYDEANKFLDALSNNDSISAATSLASQRSNSSGFNSTNTLSEGQNASYQNLASSNESLREKKEDEKRASASLAKALDGSASIDEGFGQDIADAIRADHGVPGLTFAANNMHSAIGNEFIRPYAVQALEKNSGLSFSDSAIDSFNSDSAGEVSNFNGVSVSSVKSNTSQDNVDPIASFVGASVSVPNLESSGAKNLSSLREGLSSGFESGSLKSSGEYGSTEVGFDSDGYGLDVSTSPSAISNTKSDIQDTLDKEYNTGVLGGFGQTVSGFDYDDTSYPYISPDDVRTVTSFSGGAAAPDGYVRARSGDLQDNHESSIVRGNYSRHVEAFVPEGSQEQLDRSREVWSENMAEHGANLIRPTEFVSGETNKQTEGE